MRAAWGADSGISENPPAIREPDACANLGFARLTSRFMARLPKSTTNLGHRRFEEARRVSDTHRKTWRSPCNPYQIQP
jgi:hypothetical protein